MKSSEKKQIFKILKQFLTKDFFLEDFLDGDLKEDMLHAFCMHELVWIAENDRVLLTPSGEQAVFNYTLSVEPIKKGSKL